MLTVALRITTWSRSWAKAAWVSFTPAVRLRSIGRSRSKCSTAHGGRSGQRNKFLAEAVITGDLDHPNIVPIYDLGANADGALFYAMKCVKGTPWDKCIDKKSLTENLDILLKACDAVAFWTLARHHPSRLEAREHDARRLR